MLEINTRWLCTGLRDTSGSALFSHNDTLQEVLKDTVQSI